MFALKIGLLSLAVTAVCGLLGIKRDNPENTELEKQSSIARVLRKNNLLGRRD
jgi:hypothetical protein